jgi:hypothetical protein
MKKFLNLIEYTKPTIVILSVASAIGTFVLANLLVNVGNHAIVLKNNFEPLVWGLMLCLIVLNIVIARIAFGTGKKHASGDTDANTGSSQAAPSVLGGKSGLKKYAPLVLIAGLAHKAMAWGYFILGCLVVVVGGVMLYGLYKVCTEYLPTSPYDGNPNGQHNHTNDHVQIGIVTNTNSPVDDEMACPAPMIFDSWSLAYITGLDAESGSGTKSAGCDAYSTNGFTLTYGRNSNVWMKVGMPDDWIQTAITGDTNNYTYVINAGGMSIRLSYSSTNSANSGYTYSFLDSDTNRYTLLVRRTTNFIDWVPVYTDIVVKYSAQRWTDTNAPPDRAFYNVICIGTNAPVDQ